MKPGVVIVTHYRLGRGVPPGAAPDRAGRARVPRGVDRADPVGRGDAQPDRSDALKAADRGHGVLVLTDMFGGTPSNIALSFLDEHHVEVVTGVNLPMLIKLATLGEEKPLDELAAFIKSYGQRNISVASELLPDEER